VQSEQGTAGQLPRLHVLDAFRALAISAVVVCHYLATWAPPGYRYNLYGFRHTYPSWLGWGALGVQFFFIISGFVIFMTLERCNHLFEFWFRRFARLYPAYITAMLVTFVVANEFGPREFSSTRADFIIGLAFLAPFISGTRFIDQVYWSLVVELQFYFLIGLIYVVARGRFVAAWVIFVSAGLACWIAGTGGALHVFKSLADRAFLLPYLPQFTLGIAFYHLYCKREASWRALAVTAVLTYVIVAGNAPPAWHAAHVVMVTLFLLFLWGRLGWLAIPPLTYLGEISYSLYLIHAYVGITLISLFTRHMGAPDLLAAFGAALVCGGLAYGLTKGVEIPAKRALLDWARSHVSVAARFPSLAFTPAVPQKPTDVRA
jgi:peptidoglycan/LPS O-acetylase OafA/YrhL